MHRAKNRLMALIASNLTSPKRYEIQQKADGAEATIYLYDVIDALWGVSAKQFVKDLNAIKAGTIHLRINSPGGDVFEGRAMATAIAQHPATIIAHIDGLAASAASWVALSANQVEMAQGSFFMIHKAWTLAYGNAEDLLATAAVLEKIDASLVEDYAKQTGNTAEQITQWMSDETWFTAAESIEFGFADRIAEEAAAKNAWDLSVFDKIPEAMKERAQEDQQKNAQQESDQAAEHAHQERVRRIRLLEKAA